MGLARPQLQGQERRVRLARRRGWGVGLARRRERGAGLARQGQENRVGLVLDGESVQSHIPRQNACCSFSIELHVAN